MDEKQTKKGGGFGAMRPERRREIDAARRAAQTSQTVIDEKAKKREQALSLAAAFQSWAGPRRPSK